MKASFLLVLCLLVAVSVPAFCADTAAGPASFVPKSAKPSMAIVALDDGSLKKESWWGSNWDVGNGLSDMLTTALLEKGRFRLMERNLLNKAIAEQDLGATSRVDPQTAVKIGKVIGADYLVMGKVTLFSWSSRNAGGLGGLVGGLAGVNASKTKATVAFDIRVVDAETAEILGSYSGKGEDSRNKIDVALAGGHGFGAVSIGSSDFMTTVLGVATKKAIDDWVTTFCKALDEHKLTLVAKHRPIEHPDGKILYVEGSKIIANIGTAKGYVPGDRVEIHKKGKELKDPDTGEVVKVLTQLIGTGVITKVDEKTAEIGFDLIAGANAPSEGDLVKFATPGVASSPSTPPDVTPTTLK